MSEIPMEDNSEDVLGKALRGTGLADEILEFLTGVPTATIEKLKDGEVDDDALRRVAPPLGLDPDSLVERAHQSWKPAPVELEGLRQYNTVDGVEVFAIPAPALQVFDLEDTYRRQVLSLDVGQNYFE